MNMHEIIERLKDILATQGIKNIKDAYIANVLGLSPNTLAQMKFRNKIPYKQIMTFLHEQNISINLFFFGCDVKKVKNNSKKYKTLKLFKPNIEKVGKHHNKLKPK